MDRRTAHPPGLSPLDPAAWIVRDPDYASQMAQRDALILGLASDVTAALPEARDALAAFRAALLAHLATLPDWAVERDAVTRPDGARVALSEGTLRLAGRLCQEDFLLLSAGQGEGAEYRLVAGVLCFPARWSLSQKLGRPLTAIHGPVPDYAGTLSRRVNRMFAALAPGRPLTRGNWLLAPTDRLRLDQREGARAAQGAASGRFWLRTERQTLARLDGRAVVFGVKTTLTPVADLTPDQRATLRALLAGSPEALVDYHGGAAQHAAALAALSPA